MVTGVQEITHKGFSYVTLEETDEARVKRCIFTLNSTKFKGKALKIALAKKEWQEVWKERQETDKKTEEERIKKQIEKKERRGAVKVLPPPTAAAKTSAYDDETFIPSNPYGWMKVKGRYVAIFRVPKKGKEGGILVEPKAYAHSYHNILCHIKPIRISKIMTELPESTLVDDEECSKARREEVARWANGIIKQRIASGDAIADYSKFNDHSDDENSDDAGAKRSKSSRSQKMDSSDSDFEVVGDSHAHSDEDSGENSYADSFSDIEEIAGGKRGKNGRIEKVSKTANKPGSTSAIDSQSKMLSVIDSILKHKQGSDYGDSDSQDFDLNPSSGESSDENNDEDKKGSLEEDDDDDSSSHSEDASSSDDDDDDDASSSSSSSISAKSFSDNGDGDHDGVVDFESDGEGEAAQGLVALPIESMDIDESTSEDSTQDSRIGETNSVDASTDESTEDSSSRHFKSKGEGNGAMNITDDEEMSEDEKDENAESEESDDLQLNMLVDPPKSKETRLKVDKRVQFAGVEDSESGGDEENGNEYFKDNYSSQSSDGEESYEYGDGHDAEKSRNALKSLLNGVSGPERLKLEADDSDDDIGLNIYSTAPTPKPSIVKPAQATSEAKLPTESSESKVENLKKRKREEEPSREDEAALKEAEAASKGVVWSADLVEDNKKFAYSEMVREQDEKIFAAMRDDASSSKPQIKTFSFFQRPSNPSTASPTTTATTATSFLDALPSMSAPTSSSSVKSIADLVSSKKKGIVSSSSPSLSSNADGDIDTATASTKIERSKMSLFGGLSSPSKSTSSSSITSKSITSKSNTSKSNTLNSASSTNGFVRTTEVDRINKMWGSTKGAQRQLAERSHKLATKRVKSNKSHI